MSFRTRLTSFFVVIVVVPMLAVGVLVYRLISDSERGKADARASGIASAAASLYQSESAVARTEAETIARNVALLSGGALRARVTALAAQAGLSRVTVAAGQNLLADVGDPTAIAPGVAQASGTLGRRAIIVTASELTAAQYVRELSGPDIAVVVRKGARTLSSTLAGAGETTMPSRGSVTANGTSYRAITLPFRGFNGATVSVTILSSVAATAASLGSSRVLAAVFIVGFLILAFSFSVLASRALQGQLKRFLEAARRLAGGDFSSPVPIDGNDEFAALGEEFNNMSSQLERRLEELSQERARLREAIHRIGQTFAANLDRPALLELALKTALDAVEAECGRVSIRPGRDAALAEAGREGSLAGFEEAIYAAERSALDGSLLGDMTSGETAVLAVPLGPLQTGSRAHGLITVGRRGRPFTADEREVLRTLGSEAALALENVELHEQVSRQAVTDELTGLANHRRFQELLGAEIEQVRRYHHPVGLIMLDIDDFKAINDTHGHQQGDLVLKHVARILQENSREADSPARYGGEELALILPHTDLEGAYAIAERVRTAIEALRIPRTGRRGVLRTTASLGVAASNDGTKEALIAEADAALYEAKRQGKNRTVRAAAQPAKVSTGE